MSKRKECKQLKAVENGKFPGKPNEKFEGDHEELTQ